jgi:hypothetical protein
MRRATAVLVFLLVGSIPAVIGGMAAAGACVVIWRNQSIDVLINPRSDPGHPARWIFLCLDGLFTIILAVGSFALYIPLFRLVPWLDLSRHDLPSKSLHPTLYRWMRWPIERERRLVLAHAVAWHAMAGLAMWPIERERRLVLAWMRRIRADLRDLERARRPDPVDPES